MNWKGHDICEKLKKKKMEKKPLCSGADRCTKGCGSARAELAAAALGLLLCLLFG